MYTAEGNHSTRYPLMSTPVVSLVGVCILVLIVFFLIWSNLTQPSCQHMLESNISLLLKSTLTSCNPSAR